VQAVNATAGLFAGDEVQWRVSVGPGARLRLVSPSASRVHRARRGLDGGDAAVEARLDQRFAVAAGASLEVWPELFIPHGGCRYFQRTRIDIEPGGELLFWEVLTPGRVASGEAFAFDWLRWATDVFCDDRLIARERWRLAADDPGSLSGWRGALVEAPYCATAFLVSPRLTDASPAWQRIHDLQPPEDGGTLRVGVSRLKSDGWMIRLLAADGAAMRRTVAAIRAELDWDAPHGRTL
jgi:urease accessory protein